MSYRSSAGARADLNKSSSILLLGLVILILSPYTYAYGLSSSNRITSYGQITYNSHLKVKGVEWYRSPNAYSSTAAAQSLQELKMRIPEGNYIEISLWTDMVGDVCSPRTSIESDSRVAVERAKAAGYKVYTRIRAQSVSAATLFHPDDLQLWFQTYTETVVYWATLAEEWGVDALAVCCEVTKLEPYNAEWENLVGQVRSVFSGEVGYNTNWWYTSEELQEKLSRTWFQSLDHIGVSCYWPMSQHAEPTVEELVNNWYNSFIWSIQGDDIVHDHLEVLSMEHGVPIIIVTGLASVSGASMTPWKYNNWDNPVVSWNEQANWHEATFRVFVEEPWVAGYLFDGSWQTVTNKDPNNLEFNIQDKPAEQVVADWFSRG